MIATELSKGVSYNQGGPYVCRPMCACVSAHIWMRMCMHAYGCMDRRMGGWTDGWVDGWMDGHGGEWTDGGTEGRMGGWTDGWVDGWMDMGVNGRMEGRMGGWTDGWVGGWMDGHGGEWTDGGTEGRMGGWTDGWVDGWMDGHGGEWTDGGTGGWVGGGTERQTFTVPYTCPCPADDRPPLQGVDRSQHQCGNDRGLPDGGRAPGGTPANKGNGQVSSDVIRCHQVASCLIQCNQVSSGVIRCH